MTSCKEYLPAVATAAGLFLSAPGAGAQSLEAPRVHGVLDFAASAPAAAPAGVEMIGTAPEAPPADLPIASAPVVDRPGPAQVETLVAAAALNHAGDPALRAAGLSVAGWLSLFRACVETESAFDPGAVSPKGAIGLGQLMPATAARLGVDPRDPAQNLDGAARYLIAQLGAFQRVDLALAAYNAGPEAVRQYHGIPPYAETSAYVRHVLMLYGGAQNAAVTSG